MQRSDLELGRPDLLRSEAFISGRWVHGTSTLEVFNPADGQWLSAVPALGKSETLGAVAAAEDAFTTWRDVPASERGKILRQWAELMHGHCDDLAQIVTAEQGKPLHEALEEVRYAASFLEWFAEEAKRIEGSVLTPHRSDRRLMVTRRPIGVVAAITPWNFPLAMVTRKAGPALAVGCTVVLKPSELAPLSSLALAALSVEAGVPPGVFNVVTGPPGPIGDVLTSDPRVRKFTFTGSTAVGKKLAARCADTVKRVSLELGGNAPFLVFDDADLDAAIEGAIASKYRNSGQTCVCTNRFLVQAGIYDEFARRLADAAGKLVLGLGLSGPSDVGPLINENAIAKANAHVSDAVSKGARVLTGGRCWPENAAFFLPTVLVDVAASAALCSEETFGPIAGLVKFESEEEAIALSNNTRAGLAAYVFTRDADRVWRVSERLDYGMVGVNTGLISTEVAPFGGIKESGLGREGSALGIDDYLDVKFTCVSVRC